MPPIKKDANAILYELITSLSTFQEHNERHGPDLARDESFSALVIETAKKLSELNEKVLQRGRRASQSANPSH